MEFTDKETMGHMFAPLGEATPSRCLILHIFGGQFGETITSEFLAWSGLAYHIFHDIWRKKWILVANGGKEGNYSPCILWQNVEEGLKN